MKTIYTILILFYSLVVNIAALFSHKARQWVRGRRGWKERVNLFDRQDSNVLWIHCASLGEFEQGRPLIEKIVSEKKKWKIVLTFFSPSGYEVRKGYGNADLIMYLPADTPANANYFLDRIRPDKVLIVKYEFWFNYLNQLNNRKIPTYLVSGIFRPSQYFFKWYGVYATRMFSVFTHIFVQDADSKALLGTIGYTDCTVTGDTRFDRVSQIAAAARDLPLIVKFRGEGPLFVAGSSWDRDEEIITRYINSHPGVLRWIFAPHVISEAHLSRIEKRLQVPSIRYSLYRDDDIESSVLIIDNIGMLSSVYRYASLASVGGGFGKGIHNILEAACWGIPVLFGPNYGNFREAVRLIELGGAAVFNDFNTFSAIVDKYLSDGRALSRAGIVCKSYVTENEGATENVFDRIFS
ncbi:MAG TPA: glycosyltransferase N-terminal domain-containing protein [Bacteroidales bacterium]|nr:glycosyltransferase N-terminal domain-containing protein [Bacteroidales bacterium]